MGPLGWQETVFIFVLALLIFGPKKLPELGKTIGKAMTEFRRASSELKATWDREMATVERENESLKDVTTDYQKQISSSYSDDGYNSSYYDSGYEYGYDSGSDSTASASSSTVGASATKGAEPTEPAGTAGATSEVATVQQAGSPDTMTASEPATNGAATVIGGGQDPARA
jgi:sec-independent protein translocase protein TatA